MKNYQATVVQILNKARPASVLDTPCGGGVFHRALDFATELDGIDLFCEQPAGYRNFWNADLDYGLPSQSLGQYAAIVCCEGIEHFANPGLFIESAHRHLLPQGLLIVTTPNTWYPEAKLQLFLRGFFPNFPCLIGKIKRGTHMHIMPWSFVHLYLFLTLGGFENIELHDVDEPKPKRLYERILGLPQLMYCRHKLAKAKSDEERRFWKSAGSKQSLFGRRLVVSATKAVSPALQ